MLTHDTPITARVYTLMVVSESGDWYYEPLSTCENWPFTRDDHKAFPMTYAEALERRRACLAEHPHNEIVLYRHACW